MSINQSIFYYDFSKVYGWFNEYCRLEIVSDDSFEKVNHENIIKLLNTIVEHYDFSSYLKEYNEWRKVDSSSFAGHRKTYVSNSDLDRLVGKYVNNKKYRGKGKLEYTCYLLDGILRNMRNWKP